MSEILSHFAPSEHYPHLIEKSQSERPDQALGRSTGRIVIEYGDFSFLANGATKSGGIHLIDRIFLAGADKKAYRFERNA